MRATFALWLAYASCLCGAAVACATFGPDEIPIERVQAGWLLAENAMARGSYATAVTILDARAEHLHAIRNAFVRECVTEGQRMRYDPAVAGKNWIVTHPGDFTHARTAADLALRRTPIRTDCP